MKKRITYVLTTAVLVGTAFFLGNYQTAQADNRAENLELIEITNAISGARFSFTDGENFYDFWIPEETLEENGLIDTANIVDWNTNGEELAVMTKMGYEWYAYKTDDLYQQYFYEPVD